MKLTEAKRLFFKLRTENRIEVCEEHVLLDHPEREWSVAEVFSLVKGPGRFQDTRDLNFIGERFYWRTKDVLGNAVRLVTQFEEDDRGQLILVISVGEREHVKAR